MRKLPVTKLQYGSASDCVHVCRMKHALFDAVRQSVSHCFSEAGQFACNGPNSPYGVVVLHKESRLSAWLFDLCRGIRSKNHSLLCHLQVVMASSRSAIVKVQHACWFHAVIKIRRSFPSASILYVIGPMQFVHFGCLKNTLSSTCACVIFLIHCLLQISPVCFLVHLIACHECLMCRRHMGFDIAATNILCRLWV